MRTGLAGRRPVYRTPRFYRDQQRTVLTGINDLPKYRPPKVRSSSARASLACSTVIWCLCGSCRRTPLPRPGCGGLPRSSCAHRPLWRARYPNGAPRGQSRGSRRRCVPGWCVAPDHRALNRAGTPTAHTPRPVGRHVARPPLPGDVPLRRRARATAGRRRRFGRSRSSPALWSPWGQSCLVARSTTDTALGPKRPIREGVPGLRRGAVVVWDVWWTTRPPK